jgi:5-methyltetrahydrofolate--homocysteine methyltransferase
MNLKELIKRKILIFDGAMGTQISALRLDNSEFGGYEGLNEWLNITRPDLIEKIHCDYFQAGADIIETNTFNANRIVLSEYGLENKVYEINFKAVEIAKKAKLKYSLNGDKYIAGSIGPSNVSAFIDSRYDFDSIYESYREQAKAMIEAGVDIIIFETAHDILNLKAGLSSVFDLLNIYKKDLPVIASITLDKNNLMLSGHNHQSAYSALEHFPLFAFGFNCSTGPEDMSLRLKDLAGLSRFPTFLMPNAGLPNENGDYDGNPEKFSAVMEGYGSKGLLNIAGGCCGTSPAYIKLLSEKLKGIKPREFKENRIWSLSHINAFYFDEIEPPMLIGERNNSIGSKKFKDAIASGSFNEAVEIAKKQVKAGAHALDICLANPDRNEIEDIKQFLPLISRNIKIPLMIDTTNLEIAELACKITAGKMIVNSVNFEFGEEKAIKAIELNRKYGAKIVFGLIDEDKERGIPILAERKIAIAKRAYEFMVKKNNFPQDDLIFDALVLPVAVGGEYSRSALETIKAVGEIKKLWPDIKTILGISNVSYGLNIRAREVLNSVFLHEAVKEGLDCAIVNIEKLLRYSSIDKMEIELCKDLIYATKESAAKELSDYFKEKKEVKVEKSGNYTNNEKIYFNILNGVKADIEESIREELKIKSPIEIINGPILKAMGEVGRLFSNGELIVTEVLSSAEVTKAAISVLEPELKKNKNSNRGKILLATVRGDVHDIGKNLASVIFESNGFKVIDLGIKVPAEVIVEYALKEKPDFIGLSGLLVRSTEQMSLTAKELSSNGISVPLILGGAALTEKYVINNIIPVYGAAVIYAKDAMDGLNKVLSYLSGDKISYSKGENLEVKENKVAVKEALKINSEYYPSKIAVPKDLKRKIFMDFDIDILFENLDWPMFNFKFLRAGPANKFKIKELEKTLIEFKEEIKKNKLIKAKGVYQFFKANSQNNSVLVFDENENLLTEFVFPRQQSGKFLSIADFVSPIEKGQRDYIAFCAVNCGENLRENISLFKEKGLYVKAYLLESLSLMLAESFTETLHFHIERDWSLLSEKSYDSLSRPKLKGKRYSFGYPACPDLANQAKLFSLIKPEDIGLTLTDNFMMEPVAAVSSFILHNEKAVYFSL